MNLFDLLIKIRNILKNKTEKEWLFFFFLQLQKNFFFFCSENLQSLRLYSICQEAVQWKICKMLRNLLNSLTFIRVHSPLIYLWLAYFQLHLIISHMSAAQKEEIWIYIDGCGRFQPRSGSHLLLILWRGYECEWVCLARTYFVIRTVNRLWKGELHFRNEQRGPENVS